MDFRTGLQLEYRSLADFEAARWTGLMGVATFDESPATPRGTDAPVAQVSTPVLGETGAVCEVWRTGHAVESGQRGRVRYTRSANMLFGCVTISEAELPSAGSPERMSLHEATEQAYAEILRTLDATGFPHLIRVWNYVPDINRDSHGIERYRQFNQAREAALLAGGRAVTGNVSAACALGASAGSPLVIYFLASRTAPACVENPRQISAWDYPAQYGPRPPIFSRATVLREPDGLALFISGTASIVGHRTIHAGDPGAQTRETLTNIEALVKEANRIAGTEEFSLNSLACKVYVRHPGDLQVIQSEVSAALGPEARAVYLQAEICRRDLLVEIEATAMVPLAS